MRSTQVLGGLFLAALLLLTALFFPSRSCSTNFDAGVVTEGPAPPRAAGSTGSATDAGGTENSARRFTAPGIAFSPLPGWVEERPSSSFRKAQYRLPRAEGDSEDAELAVFYFEGGGGGVEANINRWAGQFSRPDGSPIRDAAQTASRESNGIRLTVLDVRGTYNRSVGGPMSGQTEALAGYRMLAAVAETSAGPYFFKLTGPGKTVDRWEDGFSRFLDTIAPNQ